MDNKISIGDKIDFEKVETKFMVDPESRKNVYVSQVLDEAEDGKMLVAMPIQGGKIIPMSVGQRLKATFYTKSGLLQCEIVVTARYKKDSMFFMAVEEQTALQKIQRREYYRYECRIQISYRMIEGEELETLKSGNAYHVDEEHLQWKDGIMIDLSGGGIRFVSSSHEKVDSFVEVRFEMKNEEEREIVYAIAELLRSEKNPNNETIYDHRIRFWRMDNGLRERIIRYIFEEQRKKRAKQLE